MARIKDLHIRRITRPLRTTFSTSLGDKQHLTSILVTVALDDGNSGTGEVSTSFAFRHETLEVIGHVLREARYRLKGLVIEDWSLWVGDFRKDHIDVPMTVSGLEVALFRACLSQHSISEHAYWGGSLTRLDTDVTIPYTPDRRSVERWIGAAAARGFTAYKLKVGGHREEDEELLSLVHSILLALVPGFRLRLDGNQGYRVAAFLRFLNHIEASGYVVELFEQPLPKGDFKGYEKIRNKSGIPILLDESILSVDDARRAIDNNLCDGINIKVAKSGLRESSIIIDLARRAGKKLMIGCMIETMVGLSAPIFLAAGKGVFDYIDLDSVHFLYGPNAYPGIDIAGPTITVYQGS
jgi:L-Ala-D/L-Glu epimerase